jgi:hypothetical protein
MARSASVSIRIFAMRLPEFSPHTDTLAAVVLGALLATISGVIANAVEAFIRRRERERSAALLFGEVLSTLRIVLDGASAARTRGDPYGPITRRLLYAARREFDIYDRNREALMDLRDPILRADLHRQAMRIVLPLDGILDNLTDSEPGNAAARDGGFEFMELNVRALPSLIARLGVIARQDFVHYNALADPASSAGQARVSTSQAAVRATSSAAVS